MTRLLVRTQFLAQAINRLGVKSPIRETTVIEEKLLYVIYYKPYYESPMIKLRPLCQDPVLGKARNRLGAKSPIRETTVIEEKLLYVIYYKPYNESPIIELGPLWREIGVKPPQLQQGQLQCRTEKC
jgi:hypothetical protein